MPRKGYKHTNETKRKIRLARAKQINTPASNKKRSETQKGRKFSQESLNKMSIHAKKRFANKENHPNYGKTNSAEKRVKISKALIGRSYEDLHGIIKAKQLRSVVRINRAKQIFPKKDSSIEVKIQNFLRQLNVEFLTHQHMNIRDSYQCDIFIPSMNLVIECDGDYWHGNLQTYNDWNNLSQKQKIQKIRDYCRTNELEEKGFKVWRIWEKQIKEMTLPQFKEGVKNA